jgi:FMN phosphatase YigB (HAD superfamily)
MPSIAAVFLDLGNVLAFHDDPVLFRRMAAWGGAPPEQIRERMLELWDPINRGALAGDELRRAVCQAAGSRTVMAAEPFYEMWNSHVLLGKSKVVLLTNTNEMHWRFVRPLVPQFERFHALVVSCELRLAKPDPEIFQIALERAAVLPQETAYFDDVPRFVEAACALGIHGRVFKDAPTFRTQLADLGVAI